MSVRMTGRYVGNKKIELLHEPSGMKITTAAPKDNQGDGSSFSPTDLVSAGLGACMLTIIAIVAERDGYPIDGMHMHVEKNMQQSPRRIGSLPLQIHLPAALTPEARVILERAAKTCPVHHSLHPEIKIELTFHYDV